MNIEKVDNLNSLTSLTNLSNLNQNLNLSATYLPSLKLIGSIVKTSVKYAEVLIDIEELVYELKELLLNKNDLIRKESCWILRNLAVHEKNATKLFKLGFFSILKFLLFNDTETDVSLNL